MHYANSEQHPQAGAEREADQGRSQRHPRMKHQAAPRADLGGKNTLVHLRRHLVRRWQ